MPRLGTLQKSTHYTYMTKEQKLLKTAPDDFAMSLLTVVKVGEKGSNFSYYFALIHIIAIVPCEQVRTKYKCNHGMAVWCVVTYCGQLGFVA